MSANLAEATAAALLQLKQEVDAVQSRVLATELVVLSIMENHPDRAAVLDSLARGLDPSFLKDSANEPVARAAQERARRLLELWRKADPAGEQSV